MSGAERPGGLAISREWQLSARRVFWITTLICLGLPLLGIVAVTRPGFHYKSEQTMVLGMASFLIPAWIVLGGLSALVGFGLRVHPAPVMVQPATPPPPPEPAPAPPPRRRGRPVLMGTASFLTCLALTLVLSGGRELPAALATAFVAACFAVRGEWRR
ncbi:hypothetical protein ABZT49_03850 [Methylobacterium sp. EM32]|uniref:hypothetical protein n=1 Tax=Methylobacterium sp. EM32 TaxID=3163481 RepID=UPI0033BA834B